MLASLATLGGRIFHGNQLFAGNQRGVSEGTRTPDRLDHNQELYQLSYAHRGALNLAVSGAYAGGSGRTATTAAA